MFLSHCFLCVPCQPKNGSILTLQLVQTLPPFFFFFKIFCTSVSFHLHLLSSHSGEPARSASNLSTHHPHFFLGLACAAVALKSASSLPTRQCFWPLHLGRVSLCLESFIKPPVVTLAYIDFAFLCAFGSMRWAHTVHEAVRKQGFVPPWIDLEDRDCVVNVPVTLAI